MQSLVLGNSPFSVFAIVACGEAPAGLAGLGSFAGARPRHRVLVIYHMRAVKSSSCPEGADLAGVFVSDRLPFEPRWHGSPVTNMRRPENLPPTNVDTASFVHGTLPKNLAGPLGGVNRPGLGLEPEERIHPNLQPQRSSVSQLMM
jgi:hypothetical protein